MQTAEKFLNLNEVAGQLGVSTKTVMRWRFAAKYAFPKPRMLGDRLRRWRQEDINQWIRTRPTRKINND